jgi:hypothetical protein
MSIFDPALAIPDSLLAKEATEILREHSTDLLFNHSIRVYLFAAEQGRQQKFRFAMKSWPDIGLGISPRRRSPLHPRRRMIGREPLPVTAGSGAT